MRVRFAFTEVNPGLGALSTLPYLPFIRGNRQPAKNGRFKYEATFQYNSDWQGRLYSLKKVVQIVAENDAELVVITVYTFYF